MAGLQIKIKEKQVKTEYGKNILISVLFLVGWAWMYARAFSTIASGWWIFALSGSLICAGFLFLYETKWEALSFWIGLAINIVGFGICFFFFKDGLLCLANDFLSFLTGKLGKIYLDYPVTNEKDAYMAAFWIFFLLVLWTARAVKYREKATLIVLILLMSVPAACGLVQLDWGFLLVMAAAAMFLFPVSTQHCFGIVLASVLIGLLVYGVNGDFSTEKGIEKVKEQFHQWKYERKDTAMPEGDLSNVGAFKKDEKGVLALKLEEPQKLYLRGMVGEVYTGTEWRQPQSDTYIEAEDTFYWLHKYGFYGASSIGNAMLLTGGTAISEMTITNMAACRKYQYLPYGLADSRVLDERAIGDGSVLVSQAMTANGEKITSTVGDTVTVTYVPGSLPEWYQTKANLVQGQKESKLQEYLKQEQTYREYVEAQDLQITNSVVGVCERLLEDKQSEGTLGEITTMIREALEETLSYNEQIVTQNGENDFLQYTLEQSKKGYSVHYATAATLMLRYCGVPARYVEGYFLSAEEAAGYEKGETIVLTEAHAHAWAEYYLDGIGWVPFEVTPGYVDEEELSALQSLGGGKDDNEATEQTYTKSTLTYQPPIRTMEEGEEEKEPPYQLTWQLVCRILILLLLIALIILLLRIIKRYKRLCKALKQMQQENTRNAIALQYGYARKLMEYAGERIYDAPLKHQQMKNLNQEAMFSNHAMTKEQCHEMETYVKEVLTACKRSWSVWKRFRYHYVLWLYR